MNSQNSPLKSLSTASYTPIRYRTGDLARWLPDGNIEYLGRIDDQVNCAAFELGEIERTLNSHPQVDDSAVVIRQIGQQQQLVGFYVAANSERAGTLENAIREHMQAVYVHMVPAIFMALGTPLSPSGKKIAKPWRTTDCDWQCARRSRRNKYCYTVLPIQQQPAGLSVSVTELEQQIKGFWRDTLHPRDRSDRGFPSWRLARRWG